MQAADYLADSEGVQMLARILGHRLFQMRGPFSIDDGNEDPMDQNVLKEVRSSCCKSCTLATCTACANSDAHGPKLLAVTRTALQGKPVQMHPL